MRLNTSTPILFAISSLFSLGSSLPFFARKAVWLEPLVRRATYSVVPVDGGPAAATAVDGQAGATIIETVTETPAPATKTIIETDRVPGPTDYIISTKTIKESGTFQTVVVTLTPSPATATTTGYSIIDVNSPPLTIVVPEPAPISSASVTANTATASSSSIESSSVSTAPPSLSTTSTTTSSISIPTSSSASYSAAFVTSISVSVSTTSSTTHSYDNGQWHTYYPAWSNATSISTSSQSVQTTSSVAAMPTLDPTTPMNVPADSVPPAELAVGRRSPVLRRMRLQAVSPP